MAYTITNPQLGFTRIGNVDATQRHPLGTIVNAADSTLGGGEFIYLKGVANTVAGSCVVYAANYQTVLAPDAANQSQPVAFATAPILANQFGWYQIGGQVAAQKTGVAVGAADLPLFLSATPGSIMPTVAAGKQILGANSAAAAAAGDATVLISINRPMLQGQIT